MLQMIPIFCVVPNYRVVWFMLAFSLDLAVLMILCFLFLRTRVLIHIFLSCLFANTGAPTSIICRGGYHRQSGWAAVYPWSISLRHRESLRCIGPPPAGWALSASRRSHSRLLGGSWQSGFSTAQHGPSWYEMQHHHYYLQRKRKHCKPSLYTWPPSRSSPAYSPQF